MCRGPSLSPPCLAPPALGLLLLASGFRAARRPAVGPEKALLPLLPNILLRPTSSSCLAQCTMRSLWCSDYGDALSCCVQKYRQDKGELDSNNLWSRTCSCTVMGNSRSTEAQYLLSAPSAPCMSLQMCFEVCMNKVSKVGYSLTRGIPQNAVSFWMSLYAEPGCHWW